jgi:hypothetical protein
MGLKEVFSKVSAIEPQVTELASHEIALATPDDLLKKQMQSAKEIDAANGLSKSIMSTIDKLIQAYRTNEVTCNLGLTIAEDVTQQFKNLGIANPSYIVSGQKELAATKKSSQAKAKALENAKKLFN